MTEHLARERISALLFYGTVGVLAYSIFLLFRPFLAPLAWAAIVAAVCYPLHARLETRWGRTPAAAASTLLVTVAIVAPILLVMVVFVEEASQAVSSVDLSLQSPAFTRVQQLWIDFQARVIGRRIGSLEEVIRQAATWLAGLVAGQAGALLRNLVVFLADLVIMLFALFFFFRDGRAMMAALRRMLPFRADFRDLMIEQARELIQASVIAGLVVAAVQGALGGITFAALGIQAPVFWGVVMTFFALLPFAGAWVVWAPAALWLLASGSVGRGIALIVVGTCIVGLVDNFLRPALVSGRTQLNGLLVFVSLLGGVAAFGLIGLVVGPVVMATTIGLLEAYATERHDVDRAAPSETFHA
ncbi:MAG: AI-2E family transporter [Acidobacteria bacterium]|nr:AI-2E family transporter [Acidobacteriota bacterium]